MGIVHADYREDLATNVKIAELSLALAKARPLVVWDSTDSRCGTTHRDDMIKLLVEIDHALEGTIHSKGAVQC
jgi:hypothetical protein